MRTRVAKIIGIEAEGSKKWGANTCFANKIGVSTGLVGDWLYGKSEPGQHYKSEICRAYGISRDWLDTGTGPMLRESTQGEGKHGVEPKDTEKAESTAESPDYRIMYERADERGLTWEKAHL